MNSIYRISVSRVSRLAKQDKHGLQKVNATANENDFSS